MSIRKRKMTKTEQARFAAEQARGTHLQDKMAEVRSKIAAKVRGTAHSDTITDIRRKIAAKTRG